MATSKNVTCIKLLQLNQDDKDEKTLYLEFDSDPEFMPMTLMLIGLQTITRGQQKYYRVQAEGYTEINEG